MSEVWAAFYMSDKYDDYNEDLAGIFSDETHARNVIQDRLMEAKTRYNQYSEDLKQVESDTTLNQREIYDRTRIIRQDMNLWCLQNDMTMAEVRRFSSYEMNDFDFRVFELNKIRPNFDIWS